MQADFFSSPPASTVFIGPGATLLRGHVPNQAELVHTIEAIGAEAPFRRMETARGFRMSVAMTNCGARGWISDRQGYRYSAVDPLSGQPWPQIPSNFLNLARHAADAGGFPGFIPDACLINRYEKSARMGLHQDRDETDLDAPIVSVSLGLPATFQFGGLTRTERPARFCLESGDVVVWGSASRLAYHGVASLRDGEHPLTGRIRYNLTFRKTR